jgi:hypothetical protein
MYQEASRTFGTHLVALLLLYFGHPEVLSSYISGAIIRSNNHM